MLPFKNTFWRVLCPLSLYSGGGLGWGFLTRRRGRKFFLPQMSSNPHPNPPPEHRERGQERKTRRYCAILLSVTALLGLTAGCTVHPNGEREERSLAKDAGAPFVKPVAQRPPATLPANPNADDLVRVALLNNADLEQHYWDWLSAIEQIPQDGTEPTNLTLSIGAMITNGSNSLRQTTASVGNDPMADILLPPKLSVAARRALDNARAADRRFQKAKFDLRAKVLDAYFDYTLTAELIRLDESNLQLLQVTANTTESLNQAGSAGQQDVLKAQNDLDLSRNDAATNCANLISQRAALNALLGLQPQTPIPVPDSLPLARSVSYADSQLLDFAAQENPELAAIADQIRANKEGIALARLQYLPDISANFGTDLKGITQTLAASLTVPFLRYEAIHAAIEQAEANLRSTQAMRRQTLNDLQARVVLDIVSLRDADRQIDLYEHTLLPRARQMVVVGRSAYESGHSSLLDLLDGERSLIDMQRMIADLRISREKNLADLEAITTKKLAH
jgi:cobalt-zinc-cadmium efflux system outer membrane protein